MPQENRSHNTLPERKRRNYKLVCDPQLDPKIVVKLYRYNGLISGDSVPVIVKDPRLRSRRYEDPKPLELIVPKFVVDENFVGQKPPCEVTFANLGTGCTLSSLKSLCSVFGKIDDIEIFYHPSTGDHSGIAKVIFESTKSARECSYKLNGKLRFGNLLRVLQDTGGKKREMLMKEKLEQMSKSESPNVSPFNSGRLACSPQPVPPPTHTFVESGKDNLKAVLDVSDVDFIKLQQIMPSDWNSLTDEEKHNFRQNFFKEFGSNSNSTLIQQLASMMSSSSVIGAPGTATNRSRLPSSSSDHTDQEHVESLDSRIAQLFQTSNISDLVHPVSDSNDSTRSNVQSSHNVEAIRAPSPQQRRISPKPLELSYPVTTSSFRDSSYQTSSSSQYTSPSTTNYSNPGNSSIAPPYIGNNSVGLTIPPFPYKNLGQYIVTKNKDQILWENRQKIKEAYAYLVDRFVTELKTSLHRDILRRLTENTAYRSLDRWWTQCEMQYRKDDSRDYSSVQHSKLDSFNLQKKTLVDNKSHSEANALKTMEGILGISRGILPKLPSFKKKSQRRSERSHEKDNFCLTRNQENERMPADVKPKLSIGETTAKETESDNDTSDTSLSSEEESRNQSKLSKLKVTQLVKKHKPIYTSSSEDDIEDEIDESTSKPVIKNSELVMSESSKEVSSPEPDEESSDKVNESQEKENESIEESCIASDDKSGDLSDENDDADDHTCVASVTGSISKNIASDIKSIGNNEAFTDDAERASSYESSLVTESSSDSEGSVEEVIEESAIVTPPSSKFNDVINEPIEKKISVSPVDAEVTSPLKSMPDSALPLKKRGFSFSLDDTSDNFNIMSPSLLNQSVTAAFSDSLLKDISPKSSRVDDIAQKKKRRKSKDKHHIPLPESSPIPKKLLGAYRTKIESPGDDAGTDQDTNAHDLGSGIFFNEASISTSGHSLVNDPLSMNPGLLIVLVEHNYCQPPSLWPSEIHEDVAFEEVVTTDSEAEAKLLDQKPLLTTQKVSRELKTLLEPVYVSKKKRKRIEAVSQRSESDEEKILNDILVKGIDSEDIDFLRSQYEKMTNENNPDFAWLSSTKWVNCFPSRLTFSFQHKECKPSRTPSPRKKHRYDADNSPSLVSPFMTPVKGYGNTGCSRTEGFSPKKDKREKSVKRARGISFDTSPMISESNATPVPTAPTISVSKSLQSASLSREARYAQRHLLQSLAQCNIEEGTVDLFRFNTLCMRKKLLKFARSRIHDWGLFALEVIPPEEMVIEYVGQTIRASVAEEREKRYESTGIGSSYMFRIDSDLVIDATMHGNLSRFINHSCSPNCYAKVVMVDGLKKVVIYSRRLIEVGEEVTYDYKFPFEDEKIPCLCGSPQCRGSLN